MEESRIMGEGGFNSRILCTGGTARTKACAIGFVLKRTATEGIDCDYRVHHGHTFIEGALSSLSRELAGQLLMETDEGHRGLCTLISAGLEIPTIHFAHGVEVEEGGAYVVWRGRKVFYAEEGDAVHVKDPFVAGMIVEIDTEAGPRREEVESAIVEALDGFHPADNVLARKWMEGVS